MSFNPYRKKWSGAGFSPKQQPEWQALKTAAWLAHCLREGLPKTLKLDRAWYEQELHYATGHTSTTECNAGRDYDWAMAHFEVLAGAGIKWQMNIYQGDVKRMLFSLRSELGERKLQQARVDEAYLLQAIRNGYAGKKPWEIEREQLIVILGEVKRHVRRHVVETGHAFDEHRVARDQWLTDEEVAADREAREAKVEDPDWTV